MVTIEIHASEGGKDAEIFSKQLAEALGKYTAIKPTESGRIMTLSGRL